MQRATDNYVLRQMKAVMRGVILFIVSWNKWQGILSGVSNAIPETRNNFANAAIFFHSRFNLTSEQTSACLQSACVTSCNASSSEIVSLFLRDFEHVNLLNGSCVSVVFIKCLSTYSLTCLRQGTEFLMQVPVRMSTLSTMTKGFSSRVTMERWFSSASSSP